MVTIYSWEKLVQILSCRLLSDFLFFFAYFQIHHLSNPWRKQSTPFFANFLLAFSFADCYVLILLWYYNNSNPANPTNRTNKEIRKTPQNTTNTGNIPQIETMKMCYSCHKTAYISHSLMYFLNIMTLMFLYFLMLFNVFPTFLDFFAVKK